MSKSKRDALNVANRKVNSALSKIAGKSRKYRRSVPGHGTLSEVFTDASDEFIKAIIQFKRIYSRNPTMVEAFRLAKSLG